jgi:Bacterial Ig-like domain (group 3)
LGRSLAYACVAENPGEAFGDGQSDLLVATECSGHYCDSRDFVSVLLGRFNTLTALNSNLNPSIYGQPVTFAASVSSGKPKAPTGTVTFRSGSKWIGRATLSGGVTTLTTKVLAAGTWSVTATYDGDPESIKSISAPLSQGVSQASTTTTIKSSANPSAQGQPVTFTAKVATPMVGATGRVTFTAGATTLGSVPLSGGRAMLTTSALPRGANTINVTYDGSDNFMGSTASLTQIVN